MIAPKWSVKAEYLYVDLGTTTHTSINSALNTPPNVATITNDHWLTENIGRVGFNYKLGN
jgi:outer membrane immunogenic protein